MNNNLEKIFEDKELTGKIKKRLPHLFQLAEIESSRAGKIGMEVGSLRERIIIVLLIYKFGGKNVKTDIPITEAEVDVGLFDNPVSIKTITCSGFNGVKLIWTVDAEKSKEFRESYYPHTDILLVKINWGFNGGFYYIPLEIQREIFDKIGRRKCIKLPVPGTNPRGVEITGEALSKIVGHKESKFIEIFWKKEKIDYDPYKKWIDYWKE